MKIVLNKVQSQKVFFWFIFVISFTLPEYNSCDPIAVDKNLTVPPNLTLWQWEGKTFDQNKRKYKTPDDCVSDFENILCAHKRPICHVLTCQ
ncbi:hypothetical protein RO3G_13854 [Rhizopus delemar RA 99-880]|uniref:Uncharacterized protein n=1 Tax=Rhizopus delemar (strain RA 99-880 / ATCC MYA-4621 / FGSC 9543 / NRRL 43880) TaxID=246409 RepID=I1CL13_RHIO9|nr:hypothetical protein RO3G_13854 [Rhizopus delemar RA 99-880]|eukprot:EIE89143.1 hypothetical protein RO3G_13854 [Rhizopus delemar RA 99-880]